MPETQNGHELLEKLSFKELLNHFFDLYPGSKDLEEYGDIRGRLEMFAGDLSSTFDGLKNVKGKKILDIGCGSETSKDPGTAKNYAEMTPTRFFEPWHSRFMAFLGADVTGIDLGTIAHPELEPFTFHQGDITDPESLSFLAEETFDAANMNNTLTSPEMMMRKPLPEIVELAARLGGPEGVIRKLLKPTGKFINNDYNSWLLRP